MPTTRGSGRSPASFDVFSCYSSSKPFYEQKKKVLETVPPWPKFFLTDALRIADKNFPESYVLILYRFNLDLLAERHSIAREFHPVQRIFSKHPHSRLRIMDPAKE